MSEDMWTHIRVSKDTLDGLRLLSAHLCVPMSKIVGVLVSESIALYETEWGNEDVVNVGFNFQCRADLVDSEFVP